jgi:hypothetical protein
MDITAEATLQSKIEIEERTKCGDDQHGRVERKTCYLQVKCSFQKEVEIIRFENQSKTEHKIIMNAPYDDDLNHTENNNNTTTGITNDNRSDMYQH